MEVDWSDPENLVPIDELDEIPSPETLGYKILSDPYVDITGFEYVRGDSSELTGLMQNAVFNAVLQNPMSEEGARQICDDEFGRLTEEAQEKIWAALTSETSRDLTSEIVDQIYRDTLEARYPPLVACRGPSVAAVEDLEDEYDSPTAAARAGHFTHRFFDDVNIQPGDDVYYVYVHTTGYNHEGRKLPEDTKYIGVVEDMDPPQAQIWCSECGHEWAENQWGTRIQRESRCPECGHGFEDTVGDDDPFDIDGCFADWEKIAQKSVKKKARKILQHLGWGSTVDSIGDQDTFAAFV